MISDTKQYITETSATIDADTSTILGSKDIKKGVINTLYPLFEEKRANDIGEGKVIQGRNKDKFGSYLLPDKLLKLELECMPLEGLMLGKEEANLIYQEFPKTRISDANCLIKVSEEDKDDLRHKLFVKKLENGDIKSFLSKCKQIHVDTTHTLSKMTVEMAILKSVSSAEGNFSSITIRQSIKEILKKAYLSRQCQTKEAFFKVLDECQKKVQDYQKSLSNNNSIPQRETIDKDLQVFRQETSTYFENLEDIQDLPQIRKKNNCCWINQQFELFLSEELSNMAKYSPGIMRVYASLRDKILMQFRSRTFEQHYISHLIKKQINDKPILWYNQIAEFEQYFAEPSPETFVQLLETKHHLGPILVSHLAIKYVIFSHNLCYSTINEKESRCKSIIDNGDEKKVQQDLLYGPSFQEYPNKLDVIEENEEEKEGDFKITIASEVTRSSEQLSKGKDNHEEKNLEYPKLEYPENVEEVCLCRDISSYTIHLGQLPSTNLMKSLVCSIMDEQERINIPFDERTTMDDFEDLLDATLGVGCYCDHTFNNRKCSVFNSKNYSNRKCQVPLNYGELYEKALVNQNFCVVDGIDAAFEKLVCKFGNGPFSIWMSADFPSSVQVEHIIRDPISFKLVSMDEALAFLKEASHTLHNIEIQAVDEALVLRQKLAEAFSITQMGRQIAALPAPSLVVFKVLETYAVMLKRLYDSASLTAYQVWNEVLPAVSPFTTISSYECRVTPLLASVLRGSWNLSCTTKLLKLMKYILECEGCQQSQREQDKLRKDAIKRLSQKFYYGAISGKKTDFYKVIREADKVEPSFYNKLLLHKTELSMPGQKIHKKSQKTFKLYSQWYYRDRHDCERLKMEEPEFCQAVEAFAKETKRKSAAEIISKMLERHRMRLQTRPWSPEIVPSSTMISNDAELEDKEVTTVDIGENEVIKKAIDKGKQLTKELMETTYEEVANKLVHIKAEYAETSIKSWKADQERQRIDQFEAEFAKSSQYSQFLQKRGERRKAAIAEDQKRLSKRQEEEQKKKKKDTKKGDK